MTYLCNPMNLPYRYQFFKVQPDAGDLCEIHREAADPSMILFKGKYYLFPSMTGGFFRSTDLIRWDYFPLPDTLPLSDYAPDVRAVGDYLYFSASSHDKNCNFYRTKDPEAGEFEEFEGTFPFWDPNLFCDDDGRIYFYWGCSNMEPIYGVELDPETMRPLTEKKVMIAADPKRIGFERVGEDHVPGKSDAEVEAMIEMMIANAPEGTVVDDRLRAQLRGWFGNDPYIEGAWMTKHDGRYYLQFAAPGTEYNIYSDGVCVSDAPLGPFTLAHSNPYSYQPGGYACGAGHGSTLQDLTGRWWHTSTIRIANNHNFERRIGLWKAGFDADGELFCDQRYGDWPYEPDTDPWSRPPFLLLSYGKKVTASSGTDAQAITDENIKTFWQADSAEASETVCLDLGREMDVRAVQVNFADHWQREPEADMTFTFNGQDFRAMAGSAQTTGYLLEAAGEDGAFRAIRDTREDQTDLPHDFFVYEEGVPCRYIRISGMHMPYGQYPCLSGLRVFGFGDGAAPQTAQQVQGILTDPEGKELPRARAAEATDLEVSFLCGDCTGANILWGCAPDKLYHSCLIYGRTRQTIRALVQGEPVWLRVDTFNENGITEGTVMQIR